MTNYELMQLDAEWWYDTSIKLYLLYDNVAAEALMVEWSNDYDYLFDVEPREREIVYSWFALLIAEAEVN